MKKQYTYINGLVVVTDDKNGLLPAKPYTDNIEDVLVTEDEIDFLERRCSHEKYELKKMKSYRKNNFKLLKLFAWTLPVLEVAIIALFFLNSPFSVETIFGVMNKFLAGIIFIGVPIYTVFMSIFTYACFTSPSKKDISNQEEFIALLEEQLSNSLDKMQDLEKDNACEKENEMNENEIIEIASKENLDKLNERLALRMLYLENTAKINRLYKDGELLNTLIDNGFKNQEVIGEFLNYIDYVFAKEKRRNNTESFGLKFRKDNK